MMMAEEEEFRNQLEQEKLAKVEEEEKEAVHRGLTYTDTDGTVMEWDATRRAYFPQIDTDFIARYQMMYGMTESQASHDQTAQTHSQQGVVNSSASESTGTQDGNTERTNPQNYSNADYYAYYSYYYGEDYAKKWLNTVQEEEDEENENKSEEEKEEEDKNVKGQNKKKKDKEAVKRKAPEQPPAWFDVDLNKSTHVYVSGLPSQLTDEEFKEIMSKFGLIMFDPHSHKPKLKLYRNADGTLKGDGLCCYIKQESVDLALKILDGSDVHGSIISVERAKFEMKGNFDPSKKKKKLSNKAKRKIKERQEKLFDWRPDKVEGTRLRFERIVILKNMFDVKEFESDPALINELREDIHSECSKFGDVRKVQVHDRHPEGVVSVTFQNPEEADTCVLALKGRWFAKRQIIAETYDGKTRYQVNETDAEREERLRGWEQFIESDAREKPPTESKDLVHSRPQPKEDSTARQGDSLVASSSSASGAASASTEVTESQRQSPIPPHLDTLVQSSQDYGVGAAP